MDIGPRFDKGKKEGKESNRVMDAVSKHFRLSSIFLSPDKLELGVIKEEEEGVYQIEQLYPALFWQKEAK